MKRDMALVRAILKSVEDRSDAKPSAVVIPEYDEALVQHHVDMLIKAGLLVSDYRPLSGPIPVTDLTWAGHDFAGAIRSESVWAQLRSKLSAAELASLPIQALKEVALKVAKNIALAKIG